MNLANASGFQVGLALGLASMASTGPNNLMISREGLVRGRAMFVGALHGAPMSPGSPHPGRRAARSPGSIRRSTRLFHGSALPRLHGSRRNRPAASATDRT